MFEIYNFLMLLVVLFYDLGKFLWAAKTKYKIKLNNQNL